MTNVVGVPILRSMTTTGDTFTRGERIIAKAYPSAKPLTGRYIAESFPPGQHIVQLDCHGGQVAFYDVRPMPESMIQTLERDAEAPFIVADAQ